MRWVAYMPLRGGSKSIPGKNLRPLFGRPLFSWALGAAVESGCFDEVWAGTDSTAIGDAVSAEFPGQVQLFERGTETCTDAASTESAMLEFMQAVPFDVLCTIQATSPLTRPEDFRAARERFLEANADSLLTATPTRRFYWSAESEPLNYDPNQRPRRQDFPGSFEENGAFYLTRRTLLEQAQCRLGGRISIQPMPPETCIEIDEPEDWVRAENLMRSRARGKMLLSSRIRALVVDVDGTLTDGGMYYGPEGELMKKFDTRDAKGLQRLRESGMKVGIITAEDSEAVHARMRKLGVEDYFPGIADKLATLDDLARSWTLSLDEIAYMGDDINDMDCLQAVGLACCPADAVPAVRQVCHYTASSCAGQGAVREVCEMLLRQRLPG